jgi:hypothetical protein
MAHHQTGPVSVDQTLRTQGLSSDLTPCAFVNKASVQAMSAFLHDSAGVEQLEQRHSGPLPSHVHHWTLYETSMPTLLQAMENLCLEM